MRGDAVRILVLKELRDAVRNRWFLAYAVSLVCLTSVLSFLVLMSAEYGRVSGFGRTAAGLINLMLLLVPLMGLTLGALAIASERERGTLDFWLAQPLNVSDVYLGKAFGLGLALASVVASSFGVSGVALGIGGAARQPQTLLSLTGYTVLLAWVSLAMGLVVSSLVRRSSTAVSLAVVVWLFLVLVSSLGLMATAVVLRFSPAWLLALSLVNPVEGYRIALLYEVAGSLELLGPAGMYAVDRFGRWLPVVVLGALACWLGACLGVGYRALRTEVTG